MVLIVTKTSGLSSLDAVTDIAADVMQRVLGHAETRHYRGVHAPTLATLQDTVDLGSHRYTGSIWSGTGFDFCGRIQFGSINTACISCI